MSRLIQIIGTVKSDNITFLLRLLFFLRRLQVPRVDLSLESFQFALVVLKEDKIQIKTGAFEQW